MAPTSNLLLAYKNGKRWNKPVDQEKNPPAQKTSEETSTSDRHAGFESQTATSQFGEKATDWSVPSTNSDGVNVPLRASQAAIVYGAFRAAKREEWGSFALMTVLILGSEMMLDKRFPVSVQHRISVQHDSQNFGRYFGQGDDGISMAQAVAVTKPARLV